MPLAQGQILQNRYRVVKLIGQGGFGTVYRAWHTAINQPCALKENLDTSVEPQRQFQREATILAGLQHPHLPRVTDHFFIPSQGQYLIMDFVEGEDLETMLNQRGPLPETQVLAWLKQVCDALTYLHSQTPPIIHRDIKPANIKIRPDGRAMLVDFGLAKLYDAQLKTTMGAQGVTPGFSPPEQYGQGRTDNRSDIYALGATLYVLLTGEMPPDAIDRLVHGTPLKPPQQLTPTISSTTEKAVLVALELDPKRRFQSATYFQAMLQAQLMSKKQPLITNPPLTPSLSASAQSVNKAINPGSNMTPSRKKPSYWVAIGLNLLGGWGLFYVDRGLRRRWLYPRVFIAGSLFLLYTVTTTHGPGDHFLFATVGDFVVLTLLILLGTYIISFVDTLITCYRKRKHP